MFTEERATGFIRVTPQNRCPICDSDHYCSFFANMAAVVCMKVESDQSYETGIGTGYIHQLKDDPSRYRNSHRVFSALTTRWSSASQKESSSLAPLSVLNDVYSQLYSKLPLLSTHRQNLTNRGLSPDEIKQLGYVSLPEGLERLPTIKQLTKHHGRKLLSVPGFYCTRSGQVWLAGRPGMLIPCRNIDGQIIGNQLRINKEGKGSGKYRWLSATARQRQKGGVSSGTPIHVAKIDEPFREDRVWITEGILKADIASIKLNETVIGIAGIGSWKLLELRDVLNRLDVRNVV
ncbi:hypothetical protein IH992_15645, partial [Candidatus Poribacteria bacterium]|nr:hypothetical protein [Candidatus Poribacteria bacterium]